MSDVTGQMSSTGHFPTRSSFTITHVVGTVRLAAEDGLSSRHDRLIRHVIAHLVITGVLAATDSPLQQVLGHGIAAKLSQRFGEGVLNALITAPLGPAAIEVARPLPFTALRQPALADLAKRSPAQAGGRGVAPPIHLVADGRSR
jgi:hypothetical protein